MSRAIEGWKAIAAYVEVRIGLTVTEEQARHYARRGADELPVTRMGSARRPRVVAEPAALDAWCERFKRGATA